MHIFITKTQMITLAQFFKSLSDNTRLRCVTLLQKEGKLCICELTTALDLSQPKISRHLAQLRQCGLLQDSREGQWVYYRINPKLPPEGIKAAFMTAYRILRTRIEAFLAQPLPVH